MNEALKLSLESAVHGLAVFYLIAAIPCAVYLALNKSWAYFSTGLVTFGLVWFIGTFSLAKPSRQVTAGLICLILLAGFVAARPTVVTGVEGESLQTSVSRFASTDRCERANGEWTCFRYDDAISGDVGYTVKVDPLGCWTGTRETTGRDADHLSLPREISGCVRITSKLIKF